jgi:RAD51-like protein 1
MKRKLEALPLQSHIKSHIKSTKYITNKDVIGVSEIALGQHFDLGFDDVKILIEAASEMITPTKRFVTCWNLLTNNKKQHLISGIDQLDTALLGGIPADGITEVSSLAGIGKTNFVLTLCLQSLIQFPNSSVIFLDSSNSFNPIRFGEMAMAKFDGDETKVTNCLSSVFRMEIQDSKALHKVLSELEELVTVKKTKLIVLDSLGSLIQKEFGSNQNIQRNDVLSSEAQKMKYIAESFSIPIVVTNHLIKSRDIAVPMLGNTWAHCVNTRLILEKNEEIKWIRIAKSPVAENLTIPFHIMDRGVVDDTKEYQEEVFENEDIDLDLGIDLSKFDHDDFDQ